MLHCASCLCHRHRDPATLALLDEEEAAEQHALEVLLDEDAREVCGKAQQGMASYITERQLCHCMPYGASATHNQTACAVGWLLLTGWTWLLALICVAG